MKTCSRAFFEDYSIFGFRLLWRVSEQLPTNRTENHDFSMFSQRFRVFYLKNMQEVLSTSVFRRFVSFHLSLCLSSRVSDSELMFGLTFLSISLTFASWSHSLRFKRKINNKTRYAGFFILTFYYKYWKFYELSGLVREILFLRKPLNVFFPLFI